MKEPGTDVTVVHDEQLASVTPLLIDLTNHAQLDLVRSWPVEGFERKA